MMWIANIVGAKTGAITPDWGRQGRFELSGLYFPLKEWISGVVLPVYLVTFFFFNLSPSTRMEALLGAGF